MNDTSVSFRCSFELLDVLDTKAKSQRISRSALIIRILEGSLGLSPSSTDVIPTDNIALDAWILGEINSLEKRIADLESQVLQSKTNVPQVQESTPTVSLPRNWDTLRKKGLTERQLVARLQKKSFWIKANILRQWAKQGELVDITRTHDPDNLGWKLIKGLYRPIP